MSFTPSVIVATTTSFTSFISTSYSAFTPFDELSVITAVPTENEEYIYTSYIQSPILHVIPIHCPLSVVKLPVTCSHFSVSPFTYVISTVARTTSVPLTATVFSGVTEIVFTAGTNDTSVFHVYPY